MFHLLNVVGICKQITILVLHYVTSRLLTSPIILYAFIIVLFLQFNTRPRSTPQKRYFSASGTNSCLRLSEPQDLVRPEGLGKLNNSFTSSDLELVIFRLAAQCLNHYVNACPQF
jgi:hypothetical protein